MDRLQAMEIGHIQALQRVLGEYSEAMLWLSHLGDPRSAFLICVPVAYCLSRAVGLRVLWAAALSEWLNLVLKWTLNGQRPYWWVHESDLYQDHSRPVVKQYRLTCETGPGVPSGHAMVTTAVWYVIVASLATHLRTTGWSRWARLLPWLLLAGLASVICVSRLFIATHFTHQIVLGVIVGFLLGILVHSLDVGAYTTSTHVALAVSIVAATLVQSAAMTAAAMDPGWSLRLALRRCERREWVHMATTLWYCIARDAGSLLFAAAAERLAGTGEIPRRPGLRTAVLASFAGLAFAHLVESVDLPSENVGVFYVGGAAKYGLVTAGVVAIKWCCTDKAKKKSK